MLEKGQTYRNAICVLLADTLCFSFTLLERVLVLKFGTHDDSVVGVLEGGCVGGGDSYARGGWLRLIKLSESLQTWTS